MYTSVVYKETKKIRLQNKNPQNSAGSVCYPHVHWGRSRPGSGKFSLVQGVLG
jgi:hypothetical protein